MKVIYKFFWDCGRMGCIDGLFIAESEDVDAAIGQDLYFGEVLGKHSDIRGTLSKDDLTIKSADQEFIAQFETVLGKSSIGYNPLHYLQEE